MKLVIAIVQHDDAGRIVEALLDREFRTTRLDSSGGFLRKSNATLLVGVDDSRVEEVLAILRVHARSRTEVVQRATLPSMHQVDLKSAVVFIVDIEGVTRI